MSSENIAGMLMIGTALLVIAVGMSLVYRAKRKEQKVTGHIPTTSPKNIAEHYTKKDLAPEQEGEK